MSSGVPNTAWRQDAFWYAVDVVAQSGVLTPALVVNPVLRIEQASDFVWEKLVCDVTPLGSTFTTIITIQGPQEQLMGAAIPNNALYGTAQRPALIKPRVLTRNSDISFTITSTSVANITALVIVLWGYKVKDRNALNLNMPLG